MIIEVNFVSLVFVRGSDKCIHKGLRISCSSLYTPMYKERAEFPIPYAKA